MLLGLDPEAALGRRHRHLCLWVQALDSREGGPFHLPLLVQHELICFHLKIPLKS